MRVFESLLLLVLSITAPAAVAGVHAGDLLVTDANGGRVLAVDPLMGDVHVVSPVGGANLLQSPAGIVMTSFGTIYVVDTATDQLVAIDPATGGQFVVAVSVGNQPFGMALHEGTSAFELWVSARGSQEIRHLVALLGFGITSDPLSTDARWAHARGVAYNGSAIDVAMDDGQGYWKVAVSDGAIWNPLVDYDFFQVPHYHMPGVAAWDVEPYVYTKETGPFTSYTSHEMISLRDPNIVAPGIVACDPSTSAIVTYGTAFNQFGIPDSTTFGSGTIEVADGTPLDCPTALATGLDGALYVTDSVLTTGGSAQLVRLWPADSGAAPEIVAALPDAPGSVVFPAGLAVAPVSVPEARADSAAGTALAAAFALAGRRRRRRAREASAGMLVTSLWHHDFSNPSRPRSRP
jgi:hypothetical protein